MPTAHSTATAELPQSDAVAARGRDADGDEEHVDTRDVCGGSTWASLPMSGSFHSITRLQASVQCCLIARKYVHARVHTHTHAHTHTRTHTYTHTHTYIHAHTL